MIYPLLASTIPYGSYLGSVAVNRMLDRWTSGQILMGEAHPSAWKEMVADWNLIGGTAANAQAVAACQKLATQSRTAQSCVITVPTP